MDYYEHRKKSQNDSMKIMCYSGVFFLICLVAFLIDYYLI
jgi:hypothetical protein